MQQFNWRNIRSYDNSQNNAFEELVCQLARAEIIQDKVSFTRVGAPDGGVESYCTLMNGDEYGWQAKFFDSMGDSQWKQIESSFKTALLKHPRLVKYHICTPLDRQDPRIDNQKWFMDKWNHYIDEWTNFAAGQQRSIEFEYWGSSELLSRLSEEKHAGRRRFWFNSEDFSERWLNNKLDVSIDALGNRNTPKLNFELDIIKIFDGLTRDSSFKKQFDKVYNELLKKIHKVISTIREEGLAYKEQIATNCTELHQCYSSNLFVEMNEISLDKLNRTCEKIGELVSEGIDHFNRLKRQEDSNKKITHDENNKYSSEIYVLRQVSYELDRFQEFLQSPTALLANVPVLLLKGEAGIV